MSGTPPPLREPADTGGSPRPETPQLRDGYSEPKPSRGASEPSLTRGERAQQRDTNNSTENTADPMDAPPLRAAHPRSDRKPQSDGTFVEIPYDLGQLEHVAFISDGVCIRCGQAAAPGLCMNSEADSEPP